jgi:hypothetical protein
VLITNYFMWHTGDPAPEQYEGCNWVVSQVRGLSYTLFFGGTATNRKLRLAVEDHEHLLALAMEMAANPTLRLKDAPYRKVEVGVKGMAVQQNHQILRV